MMNKMKWCLQLILASGLHLFYLVGSFIGFGFLFQLLEHWNTRLIWRAFGKGGIFVTGAMGTVIHEGSHALMALIFGHRIQEIQWFRPFAGRLDGVLGYVSHSYDRQNAYQVVGNFFIGIAPIIGGTLMMMLLFKGLLPDAYSQVKQSIHVSRYVQWGEEGQFFPLLQQFGRDLSVFLKAMLSSNHLISWRGFLFGVSVYSISTHMGLSPADLKGSWTGLVMLFILMLGITFITSLLGLNVSAWMPRIITYNLQVSFFFMVGMVFSCVTLGISWIFSIFLA